MKKLHLVRKKLRNKRIAISLGITSLLINNPYIAMVKAAESSGVTEVTNGINVLKTLALSCVGGVGVIFLAWGLLDFGSAYSSGNTGEQSQSIKKVVGGIIMVAVPSLIAIFVK